MASAIQPTVGVRLHRTAESSLGDKNFQKWKKFY
jgi:hypothetical protein